MRASLATIGEPIRWAPREDELAAFLQATGWRLEGIAHAEQLSRGYLAPLGLGDETVADVEAHAIARRV